MKSLIANLTPVDHKAIFPKNVTIALAALEIDEENRGEYIQTLNEIVIIDIPTITLIMSNILTARKLLLSRNGVDKMRAKSMSEFLGIEERVLPIITIDEEYLEYMRVLSMDLDNFRISKGW